MMYLQVRLRPQEVLGGGKDQQGALPSQWVSQSTGHSRLALKSK